MESIDYIYNWKKLMMKKSLKMDIKIYDEYAYGKYA